MTMQERLEQRLQALKTEFDTGQKKLGQLEEEAQTLRHMLLRISGAIQVLQEELGQSGQSGPTGSDPP